MTPDRMPLAELNDEQLMTLSSMEAELGVTLVAYESMLRDDGGREEGLHIEGLHDNVSNHIVESDV